MSGPRDGASAAQTRAQDAYALGRNPAEADRLGRQSLELWRLAEAVLDRVRLRPGQRAIDLGCGPRGIVDLLSERVGPGGQVVGLDHDPALVDRARALVTACGLTNVDVVAGDARHTELPSSTFDLVHTRTLLVNIPDPAEVVTEMTRLARPGGWVVAVEPDLTGLLCHPPLPAWDRLAEISVAAFRVDGAQLQIGRHVPGLFRQAGLTEVEAEVRAELYPAGHSRRTIRLDLVRSMRAKIVSHEIASEQELDDLDRTLRAHLDDPDTLMIPNLYFLVWGRKFKTHLSERAVAPPHRDKSAAGGDQAGLVGEDDGLDAVAQAQFHEDAGDVGLHRRLAEEQRGGDLGVRHAAGDQAEDFEFAGGERDGFMHVTQADWAEAQLRAGVYARLSETYDAAESVPTQLERGTDHATRRGWMVAATFKDDGYSGFKEITRDGFGELIAAIEADQVDVVIVRDIDRLTRNLTD